MYSLNEIVKMNSDTKLIKNQKCLISGSVSLSDNQDQSIPLNNQKAIDYLKKSYNNFSNKKVVRIGKKDYAYNTINNRMNSKNS